MAYLKTKDLAAEFGCCKATVHRALKQMSQMDKYRGDIILSNQRGCTYRAKPDAVRDYMAHRGQADE